MTGALERSPSEQLRAEIRAALTIDVQSRNAMAFNDDIVWTYYQSVNNFIYLAPRADIEQFHYTPAIYEDRYWLEAQPQNNPERRMVVAGPYEDRAGQGVILTFADPVYVGEQFLGVMALDMKIDTMQEFVSIGQATGESMIVSENDRLIARESGFEDGVSLQPPVSNTLIDWQEDAANVLWLSSPVLANELWLVHRVTPAQLYAAAARASAATWLMLVLVGVVAVLVWRLRRALAEVIRLTHVDPLTQVLNRRGFYEKAENLLALGVRKKLSTAVLIMDIDFFKKINDSYGHAEGDNVLKQLGGYLLKARRPYDLVCRWGGEEFVMIMLLSPGDDAAAVAERMRQEAQRTRIQPGDVPITLSGGLVLLEAGEQLDSAIKRADELLYQAKSGGRNRIVAQGV